MFRKSCRKCAYFNEFHEENKVMPDKTIEQGKQHMMWCGKGHFELFDAKACAEYENGYYGYVDMEGPSEWDNRTHGLLWMIRNSRNGEIK